MLYFIDSHCLLILSFVVSKLTLQNLIRSKIIFDNYFTFHSHISAICRSHCYHIRNLRCIRRYLDLDSRKLLVNALVSSCLDYYSSLFSGFADTDVNIADTDVTKPQHIQNRLANVGTKVTYIYLHCSTASFTE